MKPLLIAKGRIIDPAQGLDEEGSLLITDGRISWMGIGDVPAPQSGQDYEVFEVPGMVVCPGFVDLHCHLREPGFGHKETIATGTKAAVRGGFTTVCCMPNTNPPLDTPAVIDYVLERARQVAAVRVLPVASVTMGRKGQVLAPLRELAAAGAVGFSDDGDPIKKDDIMRQALITSKQLGLPVIDHCEDPVGGPPEGEARVVARDIKLAKETGGWVHIAHISTAASVGLVRRAKEAGIQVTCEVTPHHLTLTQDELIRHGANAKVNPPLRTKKDVQALILGLHDDVIDAIATDHAPHTEDEKRTGMANAPSGVIGFETALGSLMTLVHMGRIPVSKLVSKLTAEPARLLARTHQGLGSLSVGARADLTIFHPDMDWVVEAGDFASKGRNTPLAGMVLKGKVMVTVVGGEVAHKDEAFMRKPRRVSSRSETKAKRRDRGDHTQSGEPQ